MDGGGCVVSELPAYGSGPERLEATLPPPRGDVVGALAALGMAADRVLRAKSFDRDQKRREAAPPDYFSEEVQSKITPLIRAVSRGEIVHKSLPPMYAHYESLVKFSNGSTNDIVVTPSLGSRPIIGSFSQSGSFAESIEPCSPVSTTKSLTPPGDRSPENSPMTGHAHISCERSLVQAHVVHMTHRPQRRDAQAADQATPTEQSQQPELTVTDHKVTTKDPGVVTTKCVPPATKTITASKACRMRRLVESPDNRHDTAAKVFRASKSFSETPTKRSGIPPREGVGGLKLSHASRGKLDPNLPDDTDGRVRPTNVFRSAAPAYGPRLHVWSEAPKSAVSRNASLSFQRSARIHPALSASPTGVLLASIEKAPTPWWTSSATKSISLVVDPPLAMTDGPELPRPSSFPRALRRTPSACSSPMSTSSSRSPFPLSLLSQRVPVDSDAAGSSDAETETSEVATSPVTAVPHRSEGGAEGNVETGERAPAATVAGGHTGLAIAESAAEAQVRIASARVADAEGGAAAKGAVEEPTVILPCGPSDAEKAMYETTNRALMVTSGIVAFLSLASGMWLYTLSSPYFWWYGPPSAFLTTYLSCQYFGVAIWGEDFKPEQHKEITKKAADDGYMPTVDVFLPVCNEPTYVLANTWKYVSELDYPHFKVHVLDDGAKDEVHALALKFGFEYMRRPNRPELKKAGNLRHAFSRTSGDMIFILDADFCPRPDFLCETLPYFMDPTIGIVQTPQFFRWREEQSWIEQGAGVSQEFFYRFVQMNQDKFNASCCCGSCAVYRRTALEPLGGMAAIEHSEDMYTGFKMSELGFKLKYVPLNLAMGTCPDDPRSFFMQQYRWCMGTLTLVSKKEFWNADVNALQKLCCVNGMLYYTGTAMLLFLGPLPVLLLIWLSPAMLRWYHVGFAVPGIIFVAVVIPCWSRQNYGMAVHRTRIIQCYAHLYAMKDCLMGTAAAWIPSGGGAKRSCSKGYASSVWLMLIYNTAVTVLIIAGSAWRFTTYDWYHFAPCIVLAAISYMLNLSTLWGL